MEDEFSFDVDENSIKEFKKAIGYDEIEKRHKRFMEGTETLDDLINGIYHYKIKNDNYGLDLDVVELKYYKKIIEEIKKQQKIIDLMANQILCDDMKTEANRFVTSQEIIEYFTNELETNNTKI